MLTRCATLTLPLITCIASTALTAQTGVTPVAHVGAGHSPVERVVYASDEAHNNVIELYGVPVDASAAPVRLNLPLPAGGNVNTALGSPLIAQTVGERALYIADQETNDVYELFIVPNDGSAPALKLSAPLVTGGDVSDFRATKTRAVYTADATVDNRNEIYSVPLDGSSAPLLLTPGLIVQRIERMSTDGSLVAFTASPGVGDGLYVVPVDGSHAPLHLGDSGPSVGFAITYFVGIQLAPEHVVYATALDDDSTIQSDVFSARLDGSTPPVRLNVGPKFSYSAGFDLAVSPDGQRVVFVHGSQLQSVRMDGTGLVTLTPSGKSTQARQFQISADSVYAVFASQGSSSSSLQLGRLDGSQTLELLAPIPGRILSVVLSPNGSDMIFTTWNSSQTTRLYGLTNPNQPVLLSGNPPANQGMSQLLTTKPDSVLAFTHDGKRVVFVGDLALDEVYNLYSVPFDGSAPPQLLNRALSGGRDVTTFRLCADGKRLLYYADQSVDDVFELYTVPVDGSAASISLNEPPVTGGDVYRYALESHAGRQVVPGP